MAFWQPKSKRRAADKAATDAAHVKDVEIDDTVRGLNEITDQLRATADRIEKYAHQLAQQREDERDDERGTSGTPLPADQ
jgi:ABC-type transporter Mla subunit MlaD